MKTYIVCILLLSSVIQINAQYNSVQNLNFEHWYEYPNNYFRLTWSPPIESNDTLLGYNIYRENELYNFQTDTILNYEESEPYNDCENFVAFCNDNGCCGAFYIKVAAVYNSTKSESVFADSAFCGGIATNISTFNNKELKIYPNPSTGNFTIQTQNIPLIINVFNNKGQKVKSLQQRSEVSIDNLSAGIYYVEIVTTTNVFVEKIMLK